MRLLLITVVLSLSLNAVAKYAGAEANQIPTATIFPSINGILFPAVVTAAGVNASALGLYGVRTDMQFAYTKGAAGDPDGLFAGTEIGSNGFGAGLGYIGEKSSTRLINNMYGGLGFKAGSVAIGGGARVLDTTQGSGAAFDFSMMSGGPTGFNAGFVVYHILKKAHVDLGLGWGGSKRYNLEVNVLLPPLMNSAGEGYVVTGAATLFGTEWLGLSTRVSYDTGPASGISYMGGATIWFNVKFNAFLFYTSPGAITGGLSFSF